MSQLFYATTKEVFKGHGKNPMFGKDTKKKMSEAVKGRKQDGTYYMIKPEEV